MIWFVLQIILLNRFLSGTGNGRRYKTDVNIHAYPTAAKERDFAKMVGEAISNACWFPAGNRKKAKGAC